MWKPTPMAPGPLWQPTTGPTTVSAGSPETSGRIRSTSSAAIFGPVGMGDHELGATPGLGRPRALLDDAVDRARIGPNPSHRLDDPVADLEDRLDVEHRAEQRARSADAPAAAQELEGLDGEEHLVGAPDRGDRRPPTLSASPPASMHPHRLADGGVVADRDAAGVDDADVEIGQRRARLGRRGVGAAQVGGDGRADDRAAVRAELPEDGLELRRRRLRGPREGTGRGQPRVELARR